MHFIPSTGTQITITVAVSSNLLTKDIVTTNLPSLLPFFLTMPSSPLFKRHSPNRKNVENPVFLKVKDYKSRNWTRQIGKWRKEIDVVCVEQATFIAVAFFKVGNCFARSTSCTNFSGVHHLSITLLLAPSVTCNVGKRDGGEKFFFSMWDVEFTKFEVCFLMV